MGCTSCKSKTTSVNVASDDNKNKRNIVSRVLSFILGIVILAVLLPVLFIAGVYIPFNSAIMDRPTNLLPSLSYFGGILMNKNKEDDEIVDLDAIDADDYELIGVEEITK